MGLNLSLIELGVHSPFVKLNSDEKENIGVDIFLISGDSSGLQNSPHFMHGTHKFTIYIVKQYYLKFKNQN